MGLNFAEKFSHLVYRFQDHSGQNSFSGLFQSHCALRTLIEVTKYRLEHFNLVTGSSIEHHLNPEDEMAGPIDRSKLRTVSPEEINKHVAEVLKMAESGDFKNNEIDAKYLGDLFSITMPKVERIYILAMKNGLKGYELIYPKAGSTKPKNPFMNERTGIVISPKNIESLNDRLSSDKKFKVDDKFALSLAGEDIVLKRI